MSCSRTLSPCTSLCADNQRCTKELRRVHGACDDAGDVATASLLENFIDEAERRTWFLFETASGGDAAGETASST
jgi:starvation-inducible DNA-binding protein